VAEQLRANWIVSDLARLLGCPTTEEPPLESSRINHIRQFVRDAAYRRWLS
jgi:hypothetical protein